MDVIHVHHPFLSGNLALRYARPLQIPIVFTNHTRYDLYAQAYMPLMPEEISEGLLRTYMPNFCQAMDLVISPSDGMENVLRKLDVKSPIVVIPNGVELDTYLNAEPLPRVDFGYGPDDIIYVYVGRLGPEKNIDLLLRAFNGVVQSYDHVRLLILGDGPAREELETLAGSFNIMDRVRFEGMVAYDQIPSYLAMCDIFLTASVTETFGMSVVEAMGAGLPVLGVDSVGVGDVVVDGETGFLTQEDPIAFAVKMTRLATEDDLRQRMSMAAREEATKYSIIRTMHMLQRHYERLVNEAEPRHRGLRFRIRSFMEKFQP
jgi:glycosyltransferase involved in cell wall biosynthesis